MGDAKFIVRAALGALCVALALFAVACSSSSSDPTSPISQGKGLVRGTVTDGEGEPAQGAVILVDGEPVTTTNEDGEFFIELEPGTYRIEAKYGEETLWSLVITIEEGESNDVTDSNDDGDVDGDDDSDSHSGGEMYCSAYDDHITETITDKLIVDSDCEIEDALVRGNVEVRGGHTLTIRNSEVRGNIECRDYEDVSIIDSTVYGNIDKCDVEYVNIGDEDGMDPNEV